MNKKIAPLILFPFIENSFKHGVSKNPKKAWIDAKLVSELNSIQLIVRNSKPDTANKDRELSHGIGLKNVKKRLEYIYAGKYDLKISETEKEYSINLTINLS